MTSCSLVELFLELLELLHDSIDLQYPARAQLVERVQSLMRAFGNDEPISVLDLYPRMVKAFQSMVNDSSFSRQVFDQYHGFVGPKVTASSAVQTRARRFTDGPLETMEGTPSVSNMETNLFSPSKDLTSSASAVKDGSGSSAQLSPHKGKATVSNEDLSDHPVAISLITLGAQEVKGERWIIWIGSVRSVPERKIWILRSFFQLHSAINHVTQICKRKGTQKSMELLRSVQIRDPCGLTSSKEAGMFDYYGAGSPTFEAWLSSLDEVESPIQPQSSVRSVNSQTPEEKKTTREEDKRIVPGNSELVVSSKSPQEESSTGSELGKTEASTNDSTGSRVEKSEAETVQIAPGHIRAASAARG